MEKLLEKQKELMASVPHDIRPGAFAKMVAGVKVVDVLLRYLNSTGHKPWRPNPLPDVVQQSLLKDLETSVATLVFIHRTDMGADKNYDHLGLYPRQLVSTFGIVEEAIEYFNNLHPNSDATPEDRLEELTDVLFFWLEQLALSGFTWAMVEAEYQRKWAVNMDRYRRAKEGDYGWDKRGENKL